ncbi:kinesin-like protein KIF14 [Lampris incognitus]|uniref:kinesin-like protein KIF14 n=1 Tax=Lampris incognitus TaxID=2546036 RepID=UPI0024B5CF19|nr:kinesin-like protein KIF14 [Lampris incognitus]
MSLFSIPARKHTAYYEHLLATSASRTPARESKMERKPRETPSRDSSCDAGKSLDKGKEIVRNYVVSAKSKSSGQQARSTPAARGRLTLQRRKTNAEKAEKTMSENTQNTTPATEKRPTLQRRTRTGSDGKNAGNDAKKVAPEQRRVDGADVEQPKVLVESNSRTPRSADAFRSASLGESGPQINAQGSAVAGDRAPSSSAAAGSTLADDVKSEDRVKTFSTPTKKTPFQKIAAKKDVFERLSKREVPRAVAVKSASLERPKIHGPVENVRSAAAPRVNTSVSSASVRHSDASPPTAQLRKPSDTVTWCQDGDASLAKDSTSTPTPTPVSAEPVVRPSEVLKQQDHFKMENSAVTVAVRVRPFSARENTEKALQVVFMNNQETVVQHPDSKHSYVFTYDFSFNSVDEKDPNFASQQMVYETLARPLLERAYEGFNTCLFTYGQTGSGKSYTMMGFEEEAGVIPRFCHELFSRLSSDANQEVTCHLEMSYFEVYNEKIHDLLITRDNQNQKQMPLRVREHPVHGPYVADLSANVVSCYKDIQGWLELGNKQRATAATGMNDKSSRSHSVFTLIMTQTKTEFVVGEEHDHRIISRINLVDLAGSERCNSAQTSGDRLREGVSINKSLLTLGKVISALSEQAMTKKKVFIPYRESVLTWLLKESLGGNSKTAMIATLSPAGSNVEESLSTLRYAQQARLIINQAKVNEDTNAKLIRELKAEVEKLRAAQMSSQGIEPERVRLFQQEIVALKSKLSWQEREMAEAHRAWKEKLELAEIRKREETRELQRAGVAFKVDNRLPNLVNLNEDPQLSEMLLYMIKEGQTRVGNLKSESAHDIQLTGALIADQHCVISNINGTVDITPMESAKTFVNGHLISESTVLHHGDRVILGGDHYFRFNHPAEVQSGKRVSCWTGSGDGMKDFEFAKNELLSAQRAQLEAEIEEAHVKAKEEMMQGIQIVKEVAQKELFDQKALYEEQIQALEKELEEENERKHLQEQAQQKVASQMVELQMAKTALEQEVDTHKKRLRLHMEAQVMKDRRVCQARIVEALEAEKKKLSKDLEEMLKKKTFREYSSPRNVPPHWDAMKLSLMIEEANKISAKLKKNTVFRRHESSDDENLEQRGELQVRVQNTKLGISTFWSLEKFQNNMVAMRELDQGEPTSKDDDVFYNPDDEWEQDLLASSTSSFSRRRSRSLLKSKRISGRLYEIRVHPIQSLHNGSSQSVGLMGVVKPPSTHSSSSDSAVPGICKELIGQSLALLRSCTGSEESMADRLASDLYLVYTAVRTTAELYNSLDDDSQENVFVCNTEAQTQLVKATSAIERAVFITMQWLARIKPISGVLYTTAEELKNQVKKMGGFLQLLIQGCESEITSMVTEAQRKSGQCLDAAFRALGHLAALTGMLVNSAELGARATGKPSAAMSLLEGIKKGVGSLLEEDLTITKEMLREAQLVYTRTPALQSLKSKTLDLARALQSYIHCRMTEMEANPDKMGEEEEGEVSHLHRLWNTAVELYQFNQATRQLHSVLISALRGKGGDLSVCSEAIASSAKSVDKLISGLPRSTAACSASSSLQLPRIQSVVEARDELHCSLQALSAAFNQQGTQESRGSSGSEKSTDDGTSSKESVTAQSRTVPKTAYTLPPGFLSQGSPHWV